MIINKSNFEGKYGPLLIAEIGGNHEGNFEYAKKLTQLAIESDVDFIKFQMYRGDTIVNKIIDTNRNLHFKKFELSKDQYLYLSEIIKQAGKKFLASVWEIEMVDWIDPYLSIYKIGSGDLTAYPIINKIVSKGKPIILSTGLAFEKEVLDTVAYIQNLNSKYTQPENLAILQCTSMYPIDNADTNLNVMKKLHNKTNLTIGYSDHTRGDKALIYATVLGAKILEFHFTDDRSNKTFRDHQVSLTPDEVKKLICDIKVIKEILGSDIKKPLEIEKQTGHTISFRRAIYPSKDLAKGHIIREDDIVVLRPNKGIDARDYYNLLGKVVEKNLHQYQELKWEYFKTLEI